MPSLLDTATSAVDEAAIVEEALPPEDEMASVAQEESDALPGESMTETEPSIVPVPDVPEADDVPVLPNEVTADAYEPVAEAQPEAVVPAAVPEKAIVADTPNTQHLAQLWYQARFAAWNGDAPQAIGRYREIIALQPGNPDAYGEMGNVMLRLGDREGAAEAYYQAAQRLAKAGNPMMAWQLLDVIAGLSPARADQLYRELRQQ
jgi:tetratricopeptide (TPR) repeat protein